MVKKLTEITKEIWFTIKLASAVVKDYIDYRINLREISETQDNCKEGYGLQVLRKNRWVKYN